MEFGTPGTGGLDLLDEFRRRGCWLPVIFITERGDVSTAVRAIKGGALDYIEKPLQPEMMIERINEALRLDAQRTADRIQLHELERLFSFLTPRERQIVYMAAEGRTIQQIATELGVTSEAVDSHRSCAMEKLKVETVAKLARLVLTRDFLLAES